MALYDGEKHDVLKLLAFQVGKLFTILADTYDELSNLMVILHDQVVLSAVDEELLGRFKLFMVIRIAICDFWPVNLMLVFHVLRKLVKIEHV